MLTAALLAGLATWSALGGPGGGPGRLRRVLRADAGRSTAVRGGKSSAEPGVPARAAIAVPPFLVGLGACLTALATTGSPAGAAVAYLVGMAAARFRRRAVKDRAEKRGRQAVRELLRGLAVELRAGAPPSLALARCLSDAGAPLGAWAAAATSGADVPGLLEAASANPGAAPLRRLAACWRVAASTGAGLAEVVDRLAADLDEDEELRREVATVLAGPRASARLLAGLPVAGVLLGSGLGAQPVRLLLYDPVGQACLIVGALLVGAGLRWTAVIAARVRQ